MILPLHSNNNVRQHILGKKNSHFSKINIAAKTNKQKKRAPHKNKKQVSSILNLDLATFAGLTVNSVLNNSEEK